MQCIHGIIRDYCRKEVTLEVEGQMFICRVGIVPRLDCAVLIGEDCPLLAQLLKMTWCEHQARTQQGLQAESEGMELPLQRSGASDRGRPLPAVCHTRGPTRTTTTRGSGSPLLSGSGTFVLMGQGLFPIGCPFPPPPKGAISAHDPPLAGQLGPKKTCDQITARFYWPGIKAQVQRYCATCRECQLHQDHIPGGGGSISTDAHN